MSRISASHPDLRAAFRDAVASTWVITSAHRGRPVGFTAISVNSVSADPPVVSFNLSKASASRGVITASGRVALHLLGKNQEHLARRYAGERSRRFAPDGSWFWHADGLPALPDPVTRMRAVLLGTHEAGDSYVITATVVHVEHDPGAPLMHHRGEYRQLDPVSVLPTHIDFSLQEATA